MRFAVHVRPGTLAMILCLATALFRVAQAEDFSLHTFQRQQLTDVYYSEGIAAGDLNRDGHVDLVYGPCWFAGPAFTEKREIFSAQPQPQERYANHFFAWVYDFTGDGWNDVLTAGFPGTPAFVYENRRAEAVGKPWPKHEVLDSVANESPQFIDIVGDERPELVCTHEGFFGYATWDPARPLEVWQFHPVSDKIAPLQFGHGLGVGDVNGDGRQDILMKDGWFEQPAELKESGRWALHRASFAAPGGAEMHAYDVDGDGDNDVITSLAAHDFGLVWHEQVRVGNDIAFKRHTIVGDQPRHSPYGLVFSEPHSVALADIDGDGLKDIVTGKTYWSHHRQSPLWDAGAVVYWFRLVRGKDGVDWVPYLADGEAGIGRQVIVHDINKDGLPDIASGGMKGAHVLLHRKEAVSQSQWKAAQPARYTGPTEPPVRGKAAMFDQTSGRVAGALEGEALKVLSTTAGKTATQKMANFRAGRWSAGDQLLWSGAKPGERLELEFQAPSERSYELMAAFTLARDFGTVRVLLDGRPLGEPLDLYNYPDVMSSGEVSLGTHKLSAGPHKLSFEITGANASALKGYLVGLDYLRLNPE